MSMAPDQKPEVVRKLNNVVKTAYERYFFKIWLVGSVVFSLFYIYVIEGMPLSLDKLLLVVFAIVLVSPFLAAFLYVIFMFVTFSFSLFIDGSRNKDPWNIFAAFLVLAGLFMYLSGRL